MQTPYPDLPPVTEEDWIIGSFDAPVTLMEYSELQCPFCAQIEPILLAAQAQFPDDIRLVFRHRPFPESFHDKSILAAQALEAAGKQEKFNDFKNFMFDRRVKNPENPSHNTLADDAFWGAVPKKDFDAWLEENITEINIDPEQLLVDMYSKEIVKKIEEAQKSADQLGINGTPTLFINGYQWPQDLPRSPEVFAIFTQLLKSQETEYNECPPEAVDPKKSYSAVITTTKGDISVDLFNDIAPNAVNSFVYLAEDGWYDGLHFFSTDEFVLSGDPSDSGYGGPGYAFMDETSDEQSLDVVGKLATYSLDSGINGSTFFINKIGLEGQESRTVFGEVTDGMDVVNALEFRPSLYEEPIDSIISIEIIEK